MTTLHPFESSGPAAAAFASSFLELQKSYDHRLTRLESEIEDLRDALLLKETIAQKPVMIPSAVVERLVVKRHNAIKVYREYRGLTQSALAHLSGVRQAMLSEIEAGKKKGSITTLKALASALDVDLDDLV